MKYLIALSALISASAFAQIPNFEARLRNVEQKTYQLEQQNIQLQRRVWDLEQYVYNHPNPNPVPPTPVTYVCAAEHPVNLRVHVGKSRSKVEAESIAYNLCTSQNVNPHMCVAYECSTESTYDHTCSITHTVSNRSFVGTVRSVTAAKALARNNCYMQTVNPQFCDIETLVCD